MSSRSKSNSDNGSRNGSTETTSTVYFVGQEPYDTFCHRVKALAQRLFPDAISIEVVRRLGGSWNRVTGVIVDGQNYILRVPRFEGSMHVDRDVAAISWLRSTTSLPVPEVVAFSADVDASFGYAFTLMRQLDGVSLESVLDGMTLRQRLDIVHRVASLILDIQAVAVPPGIGPVVPDSDGGVRIGSYADDYFRKDRGSSVSDPTAPAPTDLVDFLRTCFLEQKAFTDAMGEIQDFRSLAFRNLYKATDILIAPARFTGCNVVFHRDLAARNILVSLGPDGFYAITGVLDWDESETVPLELARVWPGWLFVTSAEDESRNWHENGWDPDAPVLEPDLRKVRDAFAAVMEAAAPGYLDSIRQVRDLKLRDFHALARRGISSTQDDALVSAIVALARKRRDESSSA